jgi:hypothetical protein
MCRSRKVVAHQPLVGDVSRYEGYRVVCSTRRTLKGFDVSEWQLYYIERVQLTQVAVLGHDVLLLWDMLRTNHRNVARVKGGQHEQGDGDRRCGSRIRDPLFCGGGKPAELSFHSGRM